MVAAVQRMPIDQPQDERTVIAPAPPRPKSLLERLANRLLLAAGFAIPPSSEQK